MLLDTDSLRIEDYFQIVCLLWLFDEDLLETLQQLILIHLLTIESGNTLSEF